MYQVYYKLNYYVLLYCEPTLYYYYVLLCMNLVTLYKVVKFLVQIILVFDHLIFSVKSVVHDFIKTSSFMHSCTTMSHYESHSSWACSSAT